MRKLFGLIIVLAICGFYANAQNPFLPLWEHIPDGEPYVFEDPDKPVLSVYISTVRTIIYAHTIADATKSYGRPRSITYVNGGMTV